MSYLNLASTIHTMNEDDLSYSYCNFMRDAVLIESSVYGTINKYADKLNDMAINTLLEGIEWDPNDVKYAYKNMDEVIYSMLENFRNIAIRTICNTYNEIYSYINIKKDFVEKAKSVISEYDLVGHHNPTKTNVPKKLIDEKSGYGEFMEVSYDFLNANKMKLFDAYYNAIDDLTETKNSIIGISVKENMNKSEMLESMGTIRDTVTSFVKKCDLISTFIVEITHTMEKYVDQKGGNE